MNKNKVKRMKNENYIKTGRTDELEKIIKNLIIDNQDTPNFNLQHILAVVSPERDKPNFDATFCRKSIMWLRDNGYITIENFVIRPTEKFINEEII